MENNSLIYFIKMHGHNVAQTEQAIGMIRNGIGFKVVQIVQVFPYSGGPQLPQLRQFQTSSSVSRSKSRTVEVILCDTFLGEESEE